MAGEKSTSSWIRQQSNAFRSFLGSESEAPHSLNVLLERCGLTYLGCSCTKEAFWGTFDTHPSRVVVLYLDVGEDGEAEVLVPAPDDTGLFCIDGQRYFAPVQRLVGDKESGESGHKKTVEYRRIDHVLWDVWTRRLQKGLGAPWLLDTGDILDWPGLCSKLVEAGPNASTSPGRRVWDMLPSDVKQEVSVVAKGRMEEALKPRVLDALNGVLDARELYEEGSFQGVALPQDAERLLKRDRESLWLTQVRRLNRRLLEATYPELIAKSRPKSQTYQEHLESWTGEGKPRESLRCLRRLFADVFARPSRSSECLLSPLDGNAWAAVAAVTQVKTLSVTKADGEEEWEPGGTNYTGLRATTMFGAEVRQPEPGLDPFHTPESENIGLIRHLGYGVRVSDDRTLESEDDGPSMGVLSRCIPYLCHDDPRRVLMGCNFLAQAQAVEGAERPHVRTKFEAELLGALPDESQPPPMGRNLRVGFMFWQGLNYEDAIVVSKSAALKLAMREIRTVSVPIPSFVTFDDRDDGEFEKGLRRPETLVREGDLLAKVVYSPMRLGLRLKGLPDEVKRDIEPFTHSIPYADYNLRSPCTGKIINRAETYLVEAGAPSAPRYRARVDFTIEIERPLQVGDKLANRHGNKGVVSAIVPDDQMPTTDGEPLEVLFNPIGVINRGNYGQLVEAIASTRDGAPSKRIVPELDAWQMNGELVYSEAKIPGAPDRCIQAVTGFNYILRLPHHAADKIHACGDGPYSRVTGQPPRGIAQKYGEMEMWALQAHGATHILEELCQERSRKKARGPQQAIIDWLAALGCVTSEADGEITLGMADLDEKPKGGIDLFDVEVDCAADPACEASKKSTKAQHLLPQVTAKRRLSSEPFFRLSGSSGVHIDFYHKKHRNELGLPYRYLPVLPPCYRLSPTGRGDHPLTKAYEEVVKLLWRWRCYRDSDPSALATEDDVDEGDGSSRRPNPEDIDRAVKRVAELLLDASDGKHGAIRRIGLCRRLTFSSRLVIVPDPCLPPDTVSVPWDVARVLFRRWLEKPIEKGRYGEDILNCAQDKIEQKQWQALESAANNALKNEWVLVNRNPSLHRYSILAFHPRVHFDGQVLKIPPLVTGPFGADFDGDQMTVVPLFTMAAKDEAKGLSICQHLWSCADGSLIPAPSKDFLLGLWLAMNDDTSLAELKTHLGECSLPTIERSDDGAVQAVSDCLRSVVGAKGDVGRALHELMKASMRALEEVECHSAYGSVNAMKAFYAHQIESGAAKDKVEEDCTIVNGICAGQLGDLARERIDIMIKAKVAIGDFGGFLRRLYYRFRSDAGQGAAFTGDMQNALVSAQSITERATQRALSPKSGSAPLEFGEFCRAVEACIASDGKLDDLDEFTQLCKMLGFGECDMRRHLNNLRQALLPEVEESSLVSLLYQPRNGLEKVLGDLFKTPRDGETRSDGKELRVTDGDPRVALFLM